MIEKGEEGEGEKRTGPRETITKRGSLIVTGGPRCLRKIYFLSLLYIYSALNVLFPPDSYVNASLPPSPSHLKLFLLVNVYGCVSKCMRSVLCRAGACLSFLYVL